MKLRQIGSNQVIITTANGTRVLYSYNTPVAAWIPADDERGKPFASAYLRTATNYSRTTSRHINGFLEGAEAVTVPQSFLEGLV